jgi:hypothetical protein
METLIKIALISGLVLVIAGCALIVGSLLWCVFDSIRSAPMPDVE